MRATPQMGVFQQPVNLGFEDSISQGRKFCSSPQNDVSIHLSPDDTLLIIVASGYNFTHWIDDQATA
jgi:hypothetical protein